METANNISETGQKPTKQIWTVGNFLSVSRILALPILIWLHYANDFQPNLEMKLVVGYIILSDFLDGFASRALNQVSEMGKWLDPLADKACAGILFAYVWWIGMVPSWLFGFIVLRDVLILAGSLLIKQKRGKVAMSVMAGKIAVNILALYWLALVFTDAETLTLILKYASVTMLGYSSYIYLKRGYEIMQGAQYE
ncbi:MAG: CDP-alcohol phosphatidyltransferase family protein [Candidatus Cyclonatronum sp.]|uniref:CDP-alcohol phosphatidyltransferase family protein n=1 Tax=Cyclonatronum sp. TaxID=3024185 RepID=UPI0025BD6300|nr:CDP-alcohol phosphatidyltransferase family protein [Cyclonatronum sp.]MCC5933474.1 CDP-alcohol phosphatidyltransferase family protein [Balneolales bacterium]MCH8485234.1 CDP-alcohol phosphatidyltransferase family protein [Cyclonatronum sp.]